MTIPILVAFDSEHCIVRRQYEVCWRRSESNNKRVSIFITNLVLEFLDAFRLLPYKKHSYDRNTPSCERSRVNSSWHDPAMCAHVAV